MLSTDDDSTERAERAERLKRAIRRKKEAAAARAQAPQVEAIPPRPTDRPAPLGGLRRALWLAHRLDPESPAYHLAQSFRVEGPLDTHRLTQALSRLVARHRMLRSTFQRAEDAAVQVVHPPETVEVPVLTVEGGATVATLEREARRPFDLEEGPLLRCTLVEEHKSGARYLLLVLHHILVDERSLALLFKELADAYAGHLSDDPPALQYDDYVHWLAAQDSSTQDKEVERWRQRLEPPPEDLDLAFEKPEQTASEGVAGPGRLLIHPVNGSVREGVRRLAARLGVTPFGVYAFAYRLLLQRTAEERPFAFGTPASTRTHPATARMLGYFTNLVTVTAAIDETHPAEAALTDFHRALRDDLAHGSLPFQDLVERLTPPRRRGRHPLFQNLFVYQESPSSISLGEATLYPLPLDLGASKLDLTLFVTEGPKALELAIEYRTDRFDESWMERLLQRYANLLEHLLADPARPTAEIPLLLSEERNRLRSWAQGADTVPAMASLPRRIFEQTMKAPEREAVLGDGQSWTHARLAAIAETIARALLEAGARPGERVALFLDRSPLLIAALLGAHRAGLAYVPLDPAYPADRHRIVLEDADVEAVLTTQDLADRLPSDAGRVLPLDAFATAKANEPLTPPDDPLPDSAAYLLYTSGSTGRPKGVVVSHENLRLSTAARLVAYDSPPQRFLLVSSIAFDSSVAGLFWTLAEGGTLVLPSEDEARDPQRLAQRITTDEVTDMLLVPSLYGHLLTTAPQALGSLRRVIVAGESCPPALVEQHFRTLPNARLFNEYGPTEATVWATLFEMTEEDAERPVAIGRPIPGVRVEVLDTRDRPVPEGVPGHAWIVGPTVAQGYWRRPALTAERFSTGPDGERRYRTGDLMTWTLDGRLLFLGRADEQIKLRGVRIEPGEVEAALLAGGGIEEAVVIARPLNDDDGPHLVAFLQAPGLETDELQSRRQNLAQRLPPAMVPSRLVMLDALPRLPNGKVNRRRLHTLTLEAEASTSLDHIPNTLEQGLLSLWEGLLGRPGLTPEDNFFEFGGHSLLVAKMTRAIERDFGATLQASDVFEHPTVGQLAQRIEKARTHGAGLVEPYHHLFPIQPTGQGTPFLFAVPHFFTRPFAEHFRGERPVYGLRGVSLRAEGNRGRWPTMTALGEELVDEIQRRFPGESYVMAGYSFGASMAFEAVRVMEARGLPVRLLLLIAPMPLYHWGPFRLPLHGLRQPLDELSTGEVLGLWARANNPSTLDPYRRIWRWFKVQPYRRLLSRLGALWRRAGRPLTPHLAHADVRVERFRLHGTWHPQPIQTPTLFFNPQEPQTDAAATWRPFFQGPLKVHEIPDPHLDDPSAEAAQKFILEQIGDLDFLGEAPSP